jgi:hypothetical protein
MIVAVVAIMLAGSVGFTQGQGRPVQDRYMVGPFYGDVQADCRDYGVGDFKLLNDWAGAVHDVIFFEKDGVTPSRVIENFKITLDVFYNSKNPTKHVVGGPGENQESRFYYEDGVMVRHEFSGPLFRVNLPRYGPIFIETGYSKLYYDGMWHLTFNSGHNQYQDRDYEALCWAVK